MPPSKPAPEPALKLVKTEDYRDGYANSVQVRMSVWDFFLVFGTMQPEHPRRGHARELPGHLSQPAAGQGAVEHPRPQPRAVRADLRLARPGAQFPQPAVPSTSACRPPPAQRHISARTPRSPRRSGSSTPSSSSPSTSPTGPCSASPTSGMKAATTSPPRWDFFRTGTLIPQSTVTNAHPPLPSILLAAWWHLSGFVLSGTRTFICIVSAAALLGSLPPRPQPRSAHLAAVTVTLLTALYPVWFAQSTLAHADIFAAAFTLWALSFYLDPTDCPHRSTLAEPTRSPANLVTIALLFSLAALSKETAIVTPAALALYELFRLLRNAADPATSRSESPPPCSSPSSRSSPGTPITTTAPASSSATPSSSATTPPPTSTLHRIVLCLYHRAPPPHPAHEHVRPRALRRRRLAHCPAPLRAPQSPRRAPRSSAIAVILLANWLAFSILGGALLTRYLLPMYPLVLLLCVAEWRRHLRLWPAARRPLAAAFLAAICLNPPYAFAPEDNLTYRDMIVLHQQAVSFIAKQFPHATVLTAWPATAELERPELGYTRTRIATVSIPNFSARPSSARQRIRPRPPTTPPSSSPPSGNPLPGTPTSLAATKPPTPATSTSTTTSSPTKPPPSSTARHLGASPPRRVGRRPPLPPHHRRLATSPPAAHP